MQDWAHQQKNNHRDVTVQSTSNLEMVVGVKACTDEVQNCRQIAAINSVMLIENQKQWDIRELREPCSKGVTLTAKGDFEQEHLPIQQRSWSIVLCSRDLPGNAYSGFSNRQFGWQDVQENVNVIQMGTKEFVKMMRIIHILEEGRVPAKGQRIGESREKKKTYEKGV